MTSVEEEMEKDGIKIDKKEEEAFKRVYPNQNIKDWQAYYKAKGFANPDTIYTPEEREVLNRRHKSVILIDEDDDFQADEEWKKNYDEWDEGSAYDSYLENLFPQKGKTIKTTSCKRRKKKETVAKAIDLKNFYGKYLSYYYPIIKVSDKSIQITIKAFEQLREIAFKEYLYRSAEAGAFLYGKNNLITHVRHYRANGSPGLITGNAIDIHKQMKRKNFMGIFHSHVFSSSSPSGTDHECLNGWTTYARAFGRKDPVSLIGCLPHFKQECYSMDKDMNVQKHKLEVI